MTRKKIKICDIKNIYEARTLGSYGVDYVGFHLISDNDLKRTKVIRQCVKELKTYFPGTKAILVTKDLNFRSLVRTINEVEFDGVQLHCSVKDECMFRSLINEFGKDFIVFQVLTVKTFCRAIKVKNMILDNSYRGGTGHSINYEAICAMSEKGLLNNVFVAGGISSDVVNKYVGLDIAGLDVQSSLKRVPKSTTENTEFAKVDELLRKIGYRRKIINQQVGFVIQDIKQQNEGQLLSALNVGIDFLHIDISDGFIGRGTDIEKTIRLINRIREINSHVPLQLHFFCENLKSFTEYYEHLLREIVNNNLTYFVHINRDNNVDLKRLLTTNKNINYSLDVKDIIDDIYPWEQYVNSQCIICAQSEKHVDRVFNINRSIKLIKYSTPQIKSITVDRGVGPQTVLYLENKSLVNVVSGSYLKINMKTGYKLMKELIYE